MLIRHSPSAKHRALVVAGGRCTTTLPPHTACIVTWFPQVSQTPPMPTKGIRHLCLGKGTRPGKQHTT